MRYTIPLLTASLLAPAALAAPPAVVTDIPPVQSLVAMVMGDLGTPEVLVPPGTDAHDMQLRPSQAQAIADAALVVWVGPQMSPWMDEAVDALAGGQARITLLDVPGTELRSYAESAESHDHGEAHGHDEADAGHDHDHGHDHGHGHDHAQDDGHGHDHGHDHAGHGHSGTDPHAWLDPENARTWVDAIAAELARLDPANAAAYAANAAATRDRITAAETAAAETLAPVKDRPIVVFHDAYGYFAAHFGMTVAGTIAPGDAANPGAGRLRDLQTQVGGDGALCVFPETNHNPALAEQLAAAGARLGEPLDPEGATLVAGADLYPQLLTGLADRIAGCLQSAS